MRYKKISSKANIARVYNTFNIKSGEWESRVPQFVTEALGKLNMNITNIPTRLADSVEAYKCKLPCDLRVLDHIEYEGRTLPRHDVSNQMFAADLEDQYHEVYSYELDTNDYAVFTFEEGDIVFHYNKFPVEKDKISNLYFPLVPDVEDVLTAIDWYILMSIMRRGYQHMVYRLGHSNPLYDPTIQWAGVDGKGGAWRRAKNRMMDMNLAEREGLSVILTNFIMSQNYPETDRFNIYEYAE